MGPESNVPSSAVTVWDVFPALAQFTAVPTLTVSVAGWKAKSTTVTTDPDWAAAFRPIGPLPRATAPKKTMAIARRSWRPYQWFIGRLLPLELRDQRRVLRS